MFTYMGAGMYGSDRKSGSPSIGGYQLNITEGARGNVIEGICK